MLQTQEDKAPYSRTKKGTYKARSPKRAKAKKRTPKPAPAPQPHHRRLRHHRLPVQWPRVNKDGPGSFALAGLLNRKRRSEELVAAGAHEEKISSSDAAWASDHLESCGEARHRSMPVHSAPVFTCTKLRNQRLGLKIAAVITAKAAAAATRYHARSGTAAPVGGAVRMVSAINRR